LRIEKSAGRTPVLSVLRQATGELHRRLEERFDAVAALADPSRRAATIRRYQTFHRSADQALSGILQEVEGLDYDRRRRAWQQGTLADPPILPSAVFPEPVDKHEALGLFYVVEGSSLGGRIILRELQNRGITDPELYLLDPYGAEAGAMWRSLVEVLAREGARGKESLASMTRGALRGFDVAERILCGELS